MIVKLVELEFTHLYNRVVILPICVLNGALRLCGFFLVGMVMRLARVVEAEDWGIVVE